MCSLPLKNNRIFISADQAALKILKWICTSKGKAITVAGYFSGVFFILFVGMIYFTVFPPPNLITLESWLAVQSDQRTCFWKALIWILFTMLVHEKQDDELALFWVDWMLHVYCTCLSPWWAQAWRHVLLVAFSAVTMPARIARPHCYLQKTTGTGSHGSVTCDEVSDYADVL